MPVFTFEKISSAKMPPPATPAPVYATSESRPRGVIAQIFGRLAEARMQRKTKGVIARNEDRFEKPARD